MPAETLSLTYSPATALVEPVPLTRLSHLASEAQQEIGREAELPSLQACAILL